MTVVAVILVAAVVVMGCDGWSLVVVMNRFRNCRPQQFDREECSLDYESHFGIVVSLAIQASCSKGDAYEREGTRVKTSKSVACSLSVLCVDVLGCQGYLPLREYACKMGRQTDEWTNGRTDRPIDL